MVVASCLPCCPRCVHDNQTIVPNPADVLQGPDQGIIPLEHSHKDRTGKKDCSTLWFWITSDPAEHSAVPSDQTYLLLSLCVSVSVFFSSSIPVCASNPGNLLSTEEQQFVQLCYFTGVDLGQRSIFPSFTTCSDRQFGENFELVNDPHYPPHWSQATSWIFALIMPAKSACHCVTVTRAFPVTCKKQRKVWSQLPLSFNEQQVCQRFDQWFHNWQCTEELRTISREIAEGWVGGPSKTTINEHSLRAPITYMMGWIFMPVIRKKFKKKVKIVSFLCLYYTCSSAKKCHINLFLFESEKSESVRRWELWFTLVLFG